MASIRKFKGKYQVQIRRSGFPSVSRSFNQLKDAKEWARQTEVQIDRGELQPDRNILKSLTLADLVFRYMQEVVPKKRGASVETIVLNCFLRHPICKKKLSSISASDFARYRDERLKDIKAATVRRQLNPIRHMFNIARYEWDMPFRENPLDRLQLTATDNKRERRLREGEYQKLLEAAETRRNPDIKRVVMFAVETAMRRGEILNLKWGQVDLKRRCVTILESKNGYSRTIPLTPTAHEILKSKKVANSAQAEVFEVTADGLKMAWGRMLVIAGLEDLRFHDLRHESISRFFEMGLSAPEVASISGHRTSVMLGRYAHANSKLVEKLIGLRVKNTEENP